MPALDLMIEPATRSRVVQSDLPLAANPFGLTRVPLRRLECMLRAPRVPGAWTTVVDTGAPLTVFPFRFWSQHAGWRAGRDYDELPLASGSRVIRQQIGGQSIGCRLVRLRVPVELSGSNPGPRLQLDDLIAFLAESGTFAHILLGLGGNALAGTALHVTRVPTSDDLAARVEF